LHDVFDTILYVATTGCQWRMLPNDFPPVSTIRGYLYAWRNDSLLDEMNRKFVALKAIGLWTTQINKRSDTAQGFEVLPRRWVVERTFGWLGRCRRLSKDWEKSFASAEAWVTIAHIRVSRDTA
jgi:transposase